MRGKDDSPYRDPAVADTYASLAAPSQFAIPAHDLVAMLAVPRGGIVLDAGTGTGVVARELAAAVGSIGLVVGIDSSIEMLRAGRRHAAYPVAVARLPGLPFADAVVDAVTAGFVITHVDSYANALGDLVRVCKMNGRVGLTVWGTLPNPAGTLWREVASRFVAGDRLSTAFRAVIPWDEWFSQAGRLEEALGAAQLADVGGTRRETVVRVATADFLLMKGSSVEGMLLRRMLDDAGRERFARDVADAFHAQFGDVVEYVRDYRIGIGTKQRSLG